MARLGAGMSQDELADAVGISKQMLSKYELGKSQPGSARLLDLAKVLGRSPRFLLSNPVFDPQEVKFRKTDGLLPSALHRIQAEVASEMEARLDLENVLGIERELDFGPLKEKVISSSGKDAEEAASLLRNHWELGSDPISNASEMLERKGIHVIALEAPEGFEGMSTRIGSGHGVIVVRQSLPADPFRYRFTLMHELGHLSLVMQAGLKKTQQEQICNAFAGAMLFPEQRVREEFGNPRKQLFLQELIDQKERYGISIAAMLYRLEFAGVIKKTEHKRIILKEILH